MLLPASSRRDRLATWLALGRVSNLPTVWSNCLAGWILGGGGTSLWPLLTLLLGTSSLYLGGMFLNDAFDAEYDRLHRRERPIPSGRISLDSVWRWGFTWIGLGTVLLVLLGNTTGAFAAILLFFILVYNAVHKFAVSAPLLMAACRSFLILTAASAGTTGATGPAIWAASAMGLYITGVTMLARHEAIRSRPPRWPAILLLAPITLSLLSNTGDYRLQAYICSLLAGLWLLRSLQPALMTKDINVPRAIHSLLAGIVIIDFLSVAVIITVDLQLVFLALFLLTLTLHRRIAGT
jgi:4-hydroxybenzoate polyprenyltransferase